ncbi:MAG: methylmalonyl-CoA mutase [Alphaproteobacteria bacterium]|nr:methylmalonyl-CoA mutase [Alphaproteobacteria bacterium]
MTDFAKDFAPPEEETWRALAEKSLKGAPWEKLVGKSADGIALKSLYRETDAATADDLSGAPGAAPFVRGLAAARNAHLPWRIRQRVETPEPSKANRDIHADLQGGVSDIELVIDPSGARGVRIERDADWADALDGVMLDLAPVALDARAHTLAVAGDFVRYLAERNLFNAAAAFNADPIGAFATTGAMDRDDIARAAELAQLISEDFPNASALRADARPAHEAGGSEGQEIGVALASGIAYLRALADAGVGVESVSRHLLFTVSVGPDALMEAAKLRALRLCWARVMEASGAAEGKRGAAIHAVTSRRMMTRYDPWTNILRATSACFAAAIGGAQAITVRPFTDALGGPTPFARRIARNTQLVLMEECHAGHVIDPAGGAWFVEKLTRELADAGWAFMQKIEIEGGIVEALSRGWLQDEIAAIREAHQREFALRKQTITGVSDFPLLDADLPAYEPLRDAAPARAAGEISCTPLPAIRWAAPLEALRAKAEAASAPPVFFATLGALAEFSARSNFARNLFAAGGVASYEPEAVYETLPELCASMAPAQTGVAVIVGTDAAYAAQAAETATSLKAAGADWVILAGRPGAHEEAWRKAGVDQFIFAGRDVLESIERLHAALGITQ